VQPGGAAAPQPRSDRGDEIVVHAPVTHETPGPAPTCGQQRAQDRAGPAAQRSPKRTDCGSEGGSDPSTTMRTGTVPDPTMPIAWAAPYDRSIKRPST